MINSAILTCLCCLLGLPGSAQEVPRAAGLYAHLETDSGRIILFLTFEKTPVSVASFVGLAEGTLSNGVTEKGTPFFDGSVFHRVVPGHVIQAGPPQRPTGKFAYTLPNEIDSSLNHGKAGMLGMANTGPHTATNQFYITLGDRSYLDGDYVVFGRVVSGLDVVKQMRQDARITRVTIERVGPKAKAFRPTDDSFQKAREQLRKDNEKRQDNRRRQERETLAKRYTDMRTTASGLEYKVLTEGMGEPGKPGDSLLLRYHGQRLGGDAFASNKSGQPAAGKAHSFKADLDKSTINKGLAEMLKTMRKGEKRTVIVPPEMGYDPVGYYGKSIAGQKRFVIRPYTTLIYELELLDINP